MRLQSPQLILREIVADDAARFRVYRGDPRFQRYYPEHECMPEEADALVSLFLSWQAEHPRINHTWAIELAETGEVIGNCGLRRRVAGSRCADIGFELSPEHWRKGFATEAADLMLAFGFDELRLHRLEAQCIADNLGSVRVLQKIGMSAEGRLREKEWFRSRWWDVLLFGVLARDWPCRV
jgi:[ribosomal protein S5]-alanine N-acetyltransferase